MSDARPLSIPVILGTTRQGRMSEKAAQAVLERLQSHPQVSTELIDIASLPLPTNDAGEAIKDRTYSEKVDGADALVIVSPEYNHGYPGLLKHVLDSCLKEYIHKAAGIVGVSAGPFGGTRMIQGLLPVLRELGLVTIFWDVNFLNVRNAFDSTGKVRDPDFARRTESFITELIWITRTLRHGHEQIALE